MTQYVSTMIHWNSLRIAVQPVRSGDKRNPGLEFAAEVISTRTELNSAQKESGRTLKSTNPDSLCDLLSRELFKNWEYTLS